MNPIMKKMLLPLVAAASLLVSAQTSRATISITATPSSQTVNLGSTFTISLSLTVTQSSAPANVTAYDLYLATASANSGYFRITGANPTGPFAAAGPTNPNGDPLSTAAASGFVRNNIDQGFSGSAQTTPFANIALETLTLSVGTNVPRGTYTFSTTTTTNSGGFYSRVSDTSGNVYEITGAGTFSINVVPEPSTWALGLLGAVAAIIAVCHRARRVGA